MSVSVAQRLTDNYRKDQESNNAKLLSTVDSELVYLLYTLNMIRHYRDIDIAKGASLDRAGRNVSEVRRTDNDAEYRRLIKVRIRANLSKGDIDTVSEIADALLGDSFVRVGETWSSTKYQNEPAGVYIRVKGLTTNPELRGEPVFLDGSNYLNGEILLDGGYDPAYDPAQDLSLAKVSLKRVMAGGVRLYWEIPEKAVTAVGISIVQLPAIRLRQVYPVPININHAVQKTLATRAAVNTIPSRLDGTHDLTGQLRLDALRDRIVHRVTVREVAA